MKTFSHRLALLAGIGVLVSFYLLYHYADVHSGFNREPSFCSISPEFDCEKLSKSPYSALFGIPVASYGLVFYLALLLTVVLLRKPGQAGYSPERAASLRFFLATLTIPVTLGLAFISKFLVGTLCLMCMMLYLINFMLLFVSWKDPERTQKGFSGWISGGSEFFSILFPAEPSVVKKGAWFTLVILAAAITYKLPEYIHDYYLKPRAEEAFSRANLLAAVKTWEEKPKLALPDFLDDTKFGPHVVFGPKDAKITIVEFSDFECPACRNYSGYLKSALEKYRDRVRFVFKHYPIDNACNRTISMPRHLLACQAAQTAVCAGAQGKEVFWKFIEAAFTRQWDSAEALNNVAESSGANREKLLSCLADPESIQRVKDDIELAIEIGVMSTPTVIVNGKLLQIHPKFLEGVLGIMLEQVEK